MAVNLSGSVGYIPTPSTSSHAAARNANARHALLKQGEQQSRQSQELNNSDEAGQLEQLSPADHLQKFNESLADLSRNVRHFGNRRDLEKKSGESSSAFDRVLEEDVVPKVQKLLQTVMGQKGDNLMALLTQARALFPDESDLYLVLKELLRQKTLSDLQRKRITALLKTVEDKADPKKLKAGINCALKARLFGAALALKASLLRQTYRQFLESDASEVDVYKDWVSTYGPKKRHVVLNFIEESLTTDIQSEDPSCALIEFGNLLTRMVMLRLLRSADSAFVKSLMKKRLVVAHEDEEDDWLVLMFNLIDSDASLDAVLMDVLGQSALSMTSEQRSVLLNSVRTSFKSLPRELFSDERIVTDTLEAFDQLLDSAYQKEQQQQRRGDQK